MGGLEKQILLPHSAKGAVHGGERGLYVVTLLFGLFLGKLHFRDGNSDGDSARQAPGIRIGWILPRGITAGRVLARRILTTGRILSARRILPWVGLRHR